MEKDSTAEESPILQLMNRDVSHEDDEDCNHKHDGQQITGINLWQTIFIITVLVAGFPLVTAEALIVSTGWLGIVVAVVISGALIYSTILLGRCWNFVRDKWPDQCHPLSTIAYEAYGHVARSTLNVFVGVTCYVMTVVVLALSMELLILLFGSTWQGKVCILQLVIAIATLPFMWLRSVKDTWQMNAAALVAVSVAFILASVGVVTLDGGSDYPNSTRSNGDAEEDSAGGTMPERLVEMSGMLLVAFAWHHVLPKVHQSMARPEKYTKVVCVSYACTAALALPLLIFNFVFRGNLSELTGAATDDSAGVFAVLPRGPLTVVPAALFLIRNAVVAVVCNNPLFQMLEEQLRISEEVRWKRIALRTVLFLTQVISSEFVPYYGVILALAGGSCLPVISLAVPALCYLRLRSIHAPCRFGESRSLWLLETAVCRSMAALAPILTFAILYVTGSAIVQGESLFTVPCYVNVTSVHD